MQTFITRWYEDGIPENIFKGVAEDLDNKRLNKQALEAWQILMTNLRLNPDGTKREGKGWLNHPATLMWQGCDLMLLKYINAMEREWQKRGYETTIGAKARETFAQGIEQGLVSENPPVPQWLADKEMHNEIVRTHRRALLAKEYDWYMHKFRFLGRPLDYEYVWYQSGYQSKAREMEKTNA